MDMESLKTVTAVTTIAGPAIKLILDTYLQPKLAKLYKEGELDRAYQEHVLHGRFEEYLTRAYTRQSYISTVVFQNQPQLLDDLYIPLSLKRRKSDQDPEIIRIDKFPMELLPRLHKVFVTDTAGMGKSTVMRYLFLSCIRENQGIPLFIELRQLSSKKSILDIICDELNPIDETISIDFLLKLIRQGEFVFFFDGYDEIPLNDREEITRQLQNFVSKAGDNSYILSSRPETALTSFSDFHHFTIHPLSNAEAFDLIRKYSQDENVSNQLIQELNSKLRSIEEFLSNPLLVSLLYKAYSYKATIPLKKHVFYRQVYDALFENHDLTKPGPFIREKYSGLDIDDFEWILRSLGYLTFKKGSVEYDKVEILGYIEQSKGLCSGVEFKNTDYLKDLCSTVPLFVADGNHYRWSHKSIQEYFAAQFICRDAKGKQNAILRSMAKSESGRYSNILDMCYDIDYNSFLDGVIFDLVRDFIQYCETSYEDIDRTQISEEHISTRQSICFGSQFLIVPSNHMVTEYNDNHELVPMLHDILDIAITLDRSLNYSTLISAGFGSKYECCYLEFSKPWVQVLDLLVHKRNKLAVGVMSGESYAQGQSAKPDHNAASPESISAIVNSLGQEAFCINERPESLCNHASLFHDVTCTISSQWISSLDLNKCKEQYRQILKHQESEHSPDLLLDNL